MILIFFLLLDFMYFNFFLDTSLLNTYPNSVIYNDFFHNYLNFCIFIFEILDYVSLFFFDFY